MGCPPMETFAHTTEPKKSTPAFRRNIVLNWQLPTRQANKITFNVSLIASYRSD